MCVRFWCKKNQRIFYIKSTDNMYLYEPRYWITLQFVPLPLKIGLFEIIAVAFCKYIVARATLLQLMANQFLRLVRCFVCKKFLNLIDSHRPCNIIWLHTTLLIYCDYLPAETIANMQAIFILFWHGSRVFSHTIIIWHSWPFCFQYNRKGRLCQINIIIWRHFPQ